MPPDLGLALLVPVHSAFLVAFPIPGGEPYSLSLLIQVIYLATLGEPSSMLVHRPQGQQDMRMRITLAFVVDGIVHAHTLRHEILLTELTQHIRILLGRHFARESQNDASGQLGIPLYFDFLGGVPKRCPIFILWRRVGREQDFGKNDPAFLGVGFPFLVIFREESFAALIGRARYGGLCPAALGDGDTEVGTWDKASLLSVLLG